jgi:hypothetical protein
MHIFEEINSNSEEWNQARFILYVSPMFFINLL